LNAVVDLTQEAVHNAAMFGNATIRATEAITGVRLCNPFNKPFKFSLITILHSNFKDITICYM
jgi:zona occludens toxin (predicted ATPase)